VGNGFSFQAGVGGLVLGQPVYLIGRNLDSPEKMAWDLGGTAS